jgi:N-hydroxyarylamine O-acetyltransferase
VLSDLQSAHLMSVPFENLTIHLGGRNVLELERNYEKIVVERRGGWCFELNGTFAWLLTELGFDVTMLSGGVYMGADFSDQLDHMVLRVDLDEPWLADVGFGENFTKPLRLVTGIDQPRGRRVYRLEPDGEALILSHDGELDLRFSLTPRTIEQFQPNSDALQSRQNSFTRQPSCSMATPDGRITLSGMRAIETRDGVRTERDMESEAERRAFLRDRFGVVVDGQFVAPVLTDL